MIKWKMALISLTAVFTVGLLNWPSIKQFLIVSEHRHVKLGTNPGLISNGWGFARRSQLHSPDLGPLLLKDPEVTSARIRELASSDKGGGNREQLVQVRGEWALMFAALRLQGKSNGQILDTPEGVELTLGTLAAEADPPAWWAPAGWLQQACKAAPQGSFRMGLVGPEEVKVLVDRADKLGEHQLPCLVHCVLRHDDGFSTEQRTRVLQAWKEQQTHYFSQNNLASVERVLDARQKLMEFLGTEGPVAIQITFPAGFNDEQKSVCRTVVEDFLRSCGCKPQAGDRLQVELALDLVDFSNVATDYFVPYKTSERVKVGERRIGKFGFSSIYKDRTVIKQERKTEVGEAHVVSLVWRVQRGEVGVTLQAPPYGEITQEKLSSIGEIASKSELTDSEMRDLNWYLANDAGGTWRYGLSDYDRHWELGE